MRPCCLSGAWLLSSVAATVCNKWLVASPAGPFGVTLVQTVATAGVAGVGLLCGTPRHPCACCADKDTPRAFWWWLAVSPVLFVAGLLANAVAMMHASLSTLVVVRNVEPLLTLAFECVAMRRAARRYDGVQRAALVGLVAGALLHQHTAVAQAVGLRGGERRRAHAGGWRWALGCACLTSATRVWQAWVIPRIGDHTCGRDAHLVACSNALASLYLACYTVGWAPEVLGAIAGADRGLAAGLALSCVPALGMAFGTVHLQSRLSGTQMAVLGATSKAAVAVLGIVALRDAADTASLCGLAVSLGACLAFGTRRARRAGTEEDHEEELTRTSLLAQQTEGGGERNRQP